MCRLRRRIREGCGFNSLMKQNKKAKNYALSFASPEKEFFFYIYDVITWGKKKSSANHYLYCVCRYFILQC
jgi:hypothetical protein